MSAPASPASTTSQWVQTLNRCIANELDEIAPNSTDEGGRLCPGFTALDEGQPQRILLQAVLEPQDHRNVTCNPCVFFNSAMGCVHGSACPYCHLEHQRQPSSGHHRHRKIARDRIKERIVACLQGPPDQVHASLQAEAYEHPYARSLIQAYLDETLDAAGRVFVAIS